MTPPVTPPAPAREAELHAMPLWIGTDEVPLGEWVLRTVPHAPGLGLWRTNSCLALGDPGLALGEAVEKVHRFYVELGREPLVQVELGSDAERAFADRGWGETPGGIAPFLTVPVSVALAAAGATDAVDCTIEGTRVRAEVCVDGERVGVARAELNGSWLGVHGLEVDESLRRRGLARALMAGVFGLGAAHGATTVWLEVATDNAAAHRLYAGLGFADHHVCRYLAAPSA